MGNTTVASTVLSHEPEVGKSFPDPFAEIRLVTLSATRGANYWSSRPVTRMDLAVGAFDEISSAERPGLTDALLKAIPGLEEHECSIGAPGGFVTRLDRGTYAPHIIEHVALELQSMIGHEVGYGRTRGGDVAGQYTVVFEHRHEATGLRAAALALDIVQHAFAGTLGDIHHVVEELRGIAQMPDVPPILPEVYCGISGGMFRAELRTHVDERLADPSKRIVDVSPGFLLQAGLPYARCDVAIILDTLLADVPERYREQSRAVRLMSVMVDAVSRGGLVIAPAKSWEIQDAARSNRCRVAVFSGADDITWKDRKVATASAWVSNDQVVLECRGRLTRTVERIEALHAHAQAALELMMLVTDSLEQR